MSHVYVYALIEGLPAAKASGGKRRIEFLPVSGIYAAIERRASAPDVNETSLREQHKTVVELGRLCDPIVPVRFGAWLALDELTNVIVSRERVLREAFEFLRHREQMTVRVFGEPVRTDDESALAAATGKAYLERLRNAARPRLTSLAEAVRRAAGSMAAAERLESGRGRLQVAIHHLTERGRSREYRALVKRAVETDTTSDQVVVSGPWPPFAFTPELWP